MSVRLEICYSCVYRLTHLYILLTKYAFVDAGNGLLWHYVHLHLCNQSLKKMYHNVFVPQFPYTCQEIRTPIIQVVSEILG